MHRSGTCTDEAASLLTKARCSPTSTNLNTVPCAARYLGRGTDGQTGKFGKSSKPWSQVDVAAPGYIQYYYAVRCLDAITLTASRKESGSSRSTEPHVI